MKKALLVTLVALSLWAGVNRVAPSAAYAPPAMVLVDIRTAGEWRETGVVEGSQLVTFFDEQGNYDAAGFLAKLARIAPKDKPVAFICRTGNRTRLVSDFVAQQGWKKVYDIDGGIVVWRRLGLPIVPLR